MKYFFQKLLTRFWGQKIINFPSDSKDFNVDIYLTLVYNGKIILMIGGNTMLTDKEKQIIIFTCSNREKEILEELNIKYNSVEL